jgi:hypothetical protein
MMTWDEDDKVRCSICLRFNKQDYWGNWVLKTTFASHSKHPIHVKAVHNQEVFLSARIDSENVPENYATLQDVIMDSPPSLHSFSNDQSGMDAEQEMFATFAGDYELDPSEVELHEWKCKEFDHRIEEYGLWGGLEGLPDDVEDIAEIWDDDEQEEMIAELLEHTGEFVWIIRSADITDSIFWE